MATLAAPPGALLTESIRKEVETKGKRFRSLRLPWGLFLLLGVPLGLIAVLGPLTAAHIYVEPLRRFWQPWPPDVAKPLIGIAGFAATLAYLAYRRGILGGFHSGTVAATAAFRNLVEGRKSGPAPVKETVPPPPPPEPRRETTTLVIVPGVVPREQPPRELADELEPLSAGDAR